ncbi:long-chain-fatty-acid--CoA ligase [Variovorax paradoxus]|nr:long-chain-fatty-acid--CoA ligase [Variovorax paradoxus]MBT2301984.1 long-chain-fatty-acid--CoA ligase [Variovorax paradoxus]
MQGTSFLKQAVACAPHKTATICNGRRRAWREVGQRVPRLAAALRSFGIADGAFVAALSMNSDRYVELFFAVPWAGGALAPLNIRWSPAENLYALTDSQASVLLVDESFIEQARDLQKQLPGLKTLIFMGEGDTPEGMLSYEALLTQHEPLPDSNRGGEDLWVIFYTGGTTAHPKGVMMSHRGLFMATITYLAMLPSIEDLSFAYVAGYFHFAGASALLYITLAGGTHVPLPKFDPVLVMQTIAEHKITNAVLVPTMINMLISHPDFDKYDLSSLATCVYGGSPMPETLMKTAMKKLPSLRFYQIFGMTETGGFATMLRWRDHVTEGPKAKRLRSAGQPAPGMQVEVRLPDGTVAPPDTLGEIVVRGETLMNGYFHNESATAAVLKDGWMYTGDAGTIDDDGFLYVADRIKDMVVTGGENVYSIEVERVLFMHPAVGEAAVIGIPSAEWGEAVHAVVVLKPGESATPEELTAFCRQHIGGYKVPRSYEFRSEPLPVTPVGKVRKNVLRDPHWAQQSRKI